VLWHIILDQYLKKAIYNMKNLFFLFAVFMSHNTVQAQKKTNKIIPPKITRQEIRMVSKDETKK
jgi:hypothetical protein